MINIQNIAVKANSSFQTVCPFPVGYIYQSTNSTSPANIFGGSWTALTDGRFMRYSGSWNSTGGETTHTLTIAEMPRHNHISIEGSYGIECSHKLSTGNIYGTSLDTSKYEALLLGGMEVGSAKYVGEDSSHNNLPPYRTCYAWYRTA